MCLMGMSRVVQAGEVRLPFVTGVDLEPFGKPSPSAGRPPGLMLNLGAPRRVDEVPGRVVAEAVGEAPAGDKAPEDEE